MGKIIFLPTITVRNNLPPDICYENVVNYHLSYENHK